MFSFLVFAGLGISCLANPILEDISFTTAQASSDGDSFSTSGIGRIRGIRLWESTDGFISGIQVRHADTWENVIGFSNDKTNELLLYHNEAIVQISGKHDVNYIYQLIFKTSRGRSLIVGQPIQKTFNMFGILKDSELRMLSGNVNDIGITSMGAKWATDYTRDVKLTFELAK